MTELQVQRLVKARADTAWAVISEPSAPANLSPEVRRVELLEAPAGHVWRRCYDHGDRVWEERSIEPVQRDSFTMEVDAPAYSWLLRNLRCTYSVRSTTAGIELGLHCNYDTAWSLIGAVAERLQFRKTLLDIASGTMDNWVARIRDRELGFRVTVATVLQRKGSHVVTVPVTATLSEVAAVLHGERIGCVMVMEDGPDSPVCGLCSERDIVRGVNEHGADALAMPVSSVMATELVIASPDNDMFFLMACMSDRRIRHLPVIEDGRLQGIISIGDVVKERIDGLEAEHETMREYIAGREWRFHRQLGAPAADPAETIT